MEFVARQLLGSGGFRKGGVQHCGLTHSSCGSSDAPAVCICDVGGRATTPSDTQGY